MLNKRPVLISDETFSLIMDNQFGLKQSDLISIINILKSQKEVEEAILFGSRAKGDYKNESDIDIALKGPGINHRLINHISFLLNEETLMPYKFDVLDYQTISNKDLTAHIDRAGKVFYSRKNDSVE